MLDLNRRGIMEAYRGTNLSLPDPFSSGTYPEGHCGCGTHKMNRVLRLVCGIILVMNSYALVAQRRGGQLGYDAPSGWGCHHRRFEGLQSCSRTSSQPRPGGPVPAVEREHSGRPKKRARSFEGCGEPKQGRCIPIHESVNQRAGNSTDR